MGRGVRAKPRSLFMRLQNFEGGEDNLRGKEGTLRLKCLVYNWMYFGIVINVVSEEKQREMQYEGQRMADRLREE